MAKWATGAIAVTTVMAAILASVPARASLDSVIASGPGQRLAQGVSFVTTGYTPPVGAISRDGTLTYVNADPVDQHNIVSNEETSDPAKWDMRYCPYLVGAPVGWETGDPISDAWKSTHPCALFFSGLINAGQSETVLTQMPDGTPKLAAGARYEFHCQPHANMKGLLVIQPEVD